VQWRERVTPGARVDVTAEMARLTLAIVGETLFSSNVQGDADEVREALGDAVSSFAFAFIPFFETLEKLPLPVFTRVRKSRERLDRIIHRVIAARRDAGGFQDPPLRDLISMLLAARDPENPDAAGMSDQQIRDEAMTIFLAGHETTANAMSWTWHLLGSAPQVEARLHAELAQVIGDRTPNADDVPKLEWTRAVVAESMRLYPPAWTMGRRAIEPHTIGGHEIEKGALVILSQFVVQRDSRWWDDAEMFKPERWLPGARSAEPGARHKYAYFPFGGGSRICIGESFAWTEAILLLATIAQRWRFTPTADPPPTPEPRITLRPKGLFMRATKR
jgi:cytochrome P450